MKLEFDVNWKYFFLPVLLSLCGCQLRDTDRSWLGIETIESRKGLRADRVQDGSPAAKAGLRQGDLLLGINDKCIDDEDDFFEQLDNEKIGSTLKLRCRRRNGAVEDLRVVVGKEKVRRGGYFSIGVDEFVYQLHLSDQQKGFKICGVGFVMNTKRVDRPYWRKGYSVLQDYWSVGLGLVHFKGGLRVTKEPLAR